MANETITFDLGKEPKTKQNLIGTVLSVQANLTYSKTLSTPEGEAIIESKPESIQLGNMYPGMIQPGAEKTEGQLAIEAAEDVAKREITASLVKLNSVRVANTPTK